MSHECVIGLLSGYEDMGVVTVSDLKEHIERQVGIREFYRRVGMEEPKVFTLRDYADWRKSTNLTRFNYCPKCGNKIDWGAIRKEEPK